MPLDTAIVRTRFAPVDHFVDARWLMAYAAGIGDESVRLFDTNAGIVGHPLFSVAPEWATVLEARKRFGEWGLTPEETLRGVHATHDLRIHRPVMPGMTLRSTLSVVAAERRSPGPFMVCRIDSSLPDGAPVVTADHGFLYLGVETVGPDRTEAGLSDPPGPVTAPKAVVPLRIGPGAAHVYTECARIWNPIHTDPAVARAAGLPGIILHGSATLAMAVSIVMSRNFAGDPARIGGVVARFSGMVSMPQQLTVRIGEQADRGRVPVEVRTEDGSTALTCRVDPHAA
jgi:acyl dehydratase